MANSLIVGAIRALLTADTSEFTAKMATATGDTKKLAEALAKDLEPRQRAVNLAVRDFMGGPEIRKAEEYSQAIKQIGDVSKLTEADQRKVNRAVEEALAHYKALGIEAPAHLQKLATETAGAAKSTGVLDQQWGKLAATFAAGALIDRAVSGLFSLGKSAFDSAGQIVDLSNKTGLSIQAVQQYGFVADQTGSSIEAFADAVFKLGVNTEKGGDKFTDALGKIGLSWESFRNLKPEEQFDAMMRGLAGLSDTQARNKVGVDLLSKSYATIAGSVDDYVSAMEQADFAGDAQIKKMDAMADAAGRLMDKMQKGAINMIGSVALALENAGRSSASFGGFMQAMLSGNYGAIANMSLSEVAMQGAKPATFPKFDTPGAVMAPSLAGVSDADRLRTATTELGRLTAAKKADIKASIEMGAKEDDLVEKYGLTADAAKLVGKFFSDQERAIGKVSAAREKDAALLDAHRETTLKNKEAIAAAMAVEDAKLAKLADGYLSANAKLKGMIRTHQDWTRTLGHSLPVEAFNVWTVLDKSALTVEDLESSLPGFEAAFTRTFTAVGTSLGLFGKSFEQLANIAGDDFDGLAKSVGETVAAMDLGWKSGAKMEEGWDQLDGSNKDLAAGFANIAAGAIAAASAIDQATGAGSTAERVLGGAASGAMAGAAFGPWGAAAGAGVGAAAGWLRAMRAGRDMIKDFAKEFDSTMSDSLSGFDELHNKLGGLGAEGEQLWANLMAVDAGDQEGAERAIRSIQEALQEAAKEAKVLEDALDDIGESDQNWQELEATAKRFGVDITQMGAAFQQARIADIGADYLLAFKNLTAAGADMSAVLAGMSDEFNTLQQEAVSAGVKLPEGMRPILAAMAEMGTLTDAAGNKIENLDGFEFEGTLEDGLKNTASAVWALVEVLGGAVPDAFRTMQSDAEKAARKMEKDLFDAARSIDEEFSRLEFTVPVNFEAGGMPGYKYDGGMPEVTLPSARTGTEGSYVNFEDGTPVMLHGLEKIVPYGEGDGRSGGGTVVVEVGGRVLARAAVPYLQGEVRRYQVGR